MTTAGRDRESRRTKTVRQLQIGASEALVRLKVEARLRQGQTPATSQTAPTVTARVAAATIMARWGSAPLGSRTSRCRQPPRNRSSPPLCRRRTPRCSSATPSTTARPAPEARQRNASCRRRHGGRPGRTMRGRGRGVEATPGPPEGEVPVGDHAMRVRGGPHLSASAEVPTARRRSARRRRCARSTPRSPRPAAARRAG